MNSQQLVKLICLHSLAFSLSCGASQEASTPSSVAASAISLPDVYQALFANSAAHAQAVAMARAQTPHAYYQALLSRVTNAPITVGAVTLRGLRSQLQSSLPRLESAASPFATMGQFWDGQTQPGGPITFTEAQFTAVLTKAAQTFSTAPSLGLSAPSDNGGEWYHAGAFCPVPGVPADFDPMAIPIAQALNLPRDSNNYIIPDSTFGTKLSVAPGTPMGDHMAALQSIIENSPIQTYRDVKVNKIGGFIYVNQKFGNQTGSAVLRCDPEDSSTVGIHNYYPRIGESQAPAAGSIPGYTGEPIQIPPTTSNQ